MVKINDTYHNTCNDQPSTWTITHLHDNEKVTVYSPQSQMSYTISRVIFEDTMRHLGFTIESHLTKPNPTISNLDMPNSTRPNLSSPSPDDSILRYRIFLVNHGYHSDYSFDFINQAIEYGKETGFEFRVELGEMVCCAWDVITGLRFYGEYQTWRQNQEYILTKVEGTYD